MILGAKKLRIEIIKSLKVHLIAQGLLCTRTFSGPILMMRISSMATPGGNRLYSIFILWGLKAAERLFKVHQDSH